MIRALEAGKDVLVEKPATLSKESGGRMLDAERNARAKSEKSGSQRSARVFVGYMRRYAHSFTGAFKREVASIPRIRYARVRDIIGSNDLFVQQSGTFPINSRYTDDIPADTVRESKNLLDNLYAETFPGQEVTDEKERFWRFIGGTGSHDLSLMRETLGFPESVSGVSVNHPFYSATFNYRSKESGETFAVTYESGIDNVPVFDAHLAVYGDDKRVSIQYDTPFVKGLAIKVRVEERNEHGEMVSREILGSYEDAYTAEWMEVHRCFRGRRDIKTSLDDAVEDLRLFEMMFERRGRDMGES